MGTRDTGAPGTNALVSARVGRESRLAVADRFAVSLEELLELQKREARSFLLLGYVQINFLPFISSHRLETVQVSRAAADRWLKVTGKRCGTIKVFPVLFVSKS